jgi:hypothetical protein
LGLPNKQKVSSTHEKDTDDIRDEWVRSGYLKPTFSSGKKPKLVGYEVKKLPWVDEGGQT